MDEWLAVALVNQVNNGFNDNDGSFRSEESAFRRNYSVAHKQKLYNVAFVPTAFFAVS